MVVEESDWRLRGQERYLQGVALVHRRYRRPPGDASRDHDHCEFCWAKFMAEDCPDTLHQGYATEDGCRWICQECFEDFKGMFGWRVVDELA